MNGKDARLAPVEDIELATELIREHAPEDEEKVDRLLRRLDHISSSGFLSGKPCPTDGCEGMWYLDDHTTRCECGLLGTLEFSFEEIDYADLPQHATDELLSVEWARGKRDFEELPDRIATRIE